MSLKKQAISGVKWTFIQQFGVQGIGFIVSIILARLLEPKEFGLIAMITVFIGIGNALLNAGLGSSLIRSKEVDEEDYSTVFYFNLVVSVLVYLIVFATAPYIAFFYKQPILISLIRWLSLTFIINAFAIIQQTRLTKIMDFKTQTIVAIPSLIIGGVIGIIMAYQNYGVWSLITFNLVKTIANTIQLWFYSKWKPLWVFNKQKFKLHFNFGYKLSISSIIDTVFTNAYVIVIGKFFPIAQLGYYQRANSLQMYPVGIISAVMGKVTYPLFAQIQDDNTRLKNMYKKILQLNIFILAPVLIIAGVLAEPLFRFLFTDKWLPAAPYFQILLITGVLYPIHAFNLNILNIKGRSDLFLRLEIFKKVIIIVVVLISFKFGILGLLYGSIVVSVTAFFINTYYSGKFINYSAWGQIKSITPILIIAILTGLLVLFFDTFTKEILQYDLLRIVINTLFGIIFYVFLSYIFKIDSLIEIINIIKKR
jgi:teichuronic acid exporter